MTMALTGKVAPYKKGFGPFPSSVYHAPYPSELQGISTADSLKAIERLFKADIDPTQVAAIIFEPVQAKGLRGGTAGICGCHPPYLRRAWHRDDRR